MTLTVDSAVNIKTRDAGSGTTTGVSADGKEAH